MIPGTALLQARRRAGLTQRALAERAAVPQSTVARIESGAIDPRASTLDALLRACGEELAAVPRLGMGEDRTLPRWLLTLTPAERLQRAQEDAESLDDLFADVRIVATE